MNNKEHLPMYGIGPLYGGVSIAVTVVAVILGQQEFSESGKIAILKIPSLIIGILLIVFGVYLWYSAVFRAKVDDGIMQNKLLQQVFMALFVTRFISHLCFFVQVHCLFQAMCFSIHYFSFTGVL